MATKTCSRCGRKKPLSAFYQQAGGAQGRRSRCKTCYKELERESYVKDRAVQERRQILERWRDEGLTI
jgi:recombinational DNA repair protein (RecF pathway)